MPEHNRKAVLDDNALLAFYKACGVSPKTIEGAIRQRYEEPPQFVAQQRARIARERKRNSTKDEESK